MKQTNSCTWHFWIQLCLNHMLSMRNRKKMIHSHRKCLKAWCWCVFLVKLSVTQRNQQKYKDVRYFKATFWSGDIIISLNLPFQLSQEGKIQISPSATTERNFVYNINALNWNITKPRPNFSAVSAIGNWDLKGNILFQNQ